MAVADFSEVDVTLLMLTYGRPECLAPQLRMLEEQSYQGRLELVIWNNKPAIADQVHAATQALRRFPVTVITSGSNYIGQARCAVAQLARGRLFMLCDDDVLLGKDFLRNFVDGFMRYGPRVVISGSGHQIDNPMTDKLGGMDAPHVDFPASDAYVDYAHGSTLLTSTDLYREASSVPMPRREYVWADDLWLSYVWSFLLRVPLVKIRCDAQWHPSFRDPAIALHKNPLVAAEQTSILRDHMRSHLLARRPRGVPGAAQAAEAPPAPRAHEAVLRGTRLRRRGP